MNGLSKTLLIILSLISFSTFADDNPQIFKLHTTAFTEQTQIAPTYTCDGKDLSPELDWSNSPPATQTFALIMSDPDVASGTFYHWILYNIPKSILSLPEGINPLPNGVIVGKNSYGKLQYNGPCPPPGATHRYVFTLYALDASLILPAGSDAKTLLNEMQGHVLQEVKLVTTYKRQ